MVTRNCRLICSELDARWLERDAAIPGDEIFLALPFCFGVNLAAGYFNYEVEDVFAHLRDAFSPGITAWLLYGRTIEGE